MLDCVECQNKERNPKSKPKNDAFSPEDEACLECPVCAEVFDETDRFFFPCPCNYQVCSWCVHTIRIQFEGKCPGCRKVYDESDYRFTPCTPEPEGDMETTNDSVTYALTEPDAGSKTGKDNSENESPPLVDAEYVTPDVKGRNRRRQNAPRRYNTRRQFPYFVCQDAPPPNQMQEGRGYRADEERGYRADEERGYRRDEERGYRADEERGYRRDEERGYRTDEERQYRRDEERGYRADEERANHFYGRCKYKRSGGSHPRPSHTKRHYSNNESIARCPSTPRHLHPAPYPNFPSAVCMFQTGMSNFRGARGPMASFRPLRHIEYHPRPAGFGYHRQQYLPRGGWGRLVTCDRIERLPQPIDHPTFSPGIPATASQHCMPSRAISNPNFCPNNKRCNRRSSQSYPIRHEDRH